MLLLLKTTQLWLNIYENYFLMPEMFKLSVVILGILQFRNFLSKWCLKYSLWHYFRYFQNPDV